MSASNSQRTNLGIDKGIEPPVTHAWERRRGPLAKLMLAMKKGDSIFVSEQNRETVKSRAKLYLGRGNYAIRQEGHGVRVWRLK